MRHLLIGVDAGRRIEGLSDRHHTGERRRASPERGPQAVRVVFLPEFSQPRVHRRPADLHEREFEEAQDGRHQGVGALPLLLPAEDDRPVRHPLQQPLRRFGRDSTGGGNRFRRPRGEAHRRGHGRLLRTEENAENFIELPRLRRAGGVGIQNQTEFFIAVHSFPFLN